MASYFRGGGGLIIFRRYRLSPSINAGRALCTESFQFNEGCKFVNTGLTDVA